MKYKKKKKTYFVYTSILYLYFLTFSEMKYIYFKYNSEFEKK